MPEVGSFQSPLGVLDNLSPMVPSAGLLASGASGATGVVGSFSGIAAELFRCAPTLTYKLLKEIIMTNITVAPLKGIRQKRFEKLIQDIRAGKKAAVHGLNLDGHFIFDWIVKDAWEHYAAFSPDPTIVKFYTSKEVFGDDDSWATYSRGQQIALGRCLAYFVKKEMLPLACVNPSQNNKLYMLFNQD